MKARRIVLVVVLPLILATPLAAEAQKARIFRIGVLLTSDVERTQARLRTELHELGYVEGQNSLIEFRSVAAGQTDRLADLAAELVRLHVDVIVAQFTPAAKAAKGATTVIPVVMAPAGDPVGTGLISSLARPGGNVTGVSGSATELGGKLLQLIRELLPAVNNVAVLVHTTDPFARPFLEQIQAGARDLGVRIQPFVVQGANEFNSAFAAMVKARASVVVAQPLLATERAAELAMKHHLPSFSIIGSFPRVGGVMSYSPDTGNMYRRAAMYVDKILKGAKPADLPVEQPTKFELVVNLKTAKALGLTIPPSVLLRADQVIE